jgi:prolipoprotein diacylglyceryltransferase
MGLLILWLLWRRREHAHGQGWLFALYLVLTGAARFVVEFFRSKDDRLLGPLTLAQGLSLVVIAIGAWLMTKAKAPAGVPAAAA